MRLSISASLLITLLWSSTGIAQSPPTEPKPVQVAEEPAGVPMLKDLPILGDLFRRQRGRWVSLDSPGGPGAWWRDAQKGREEKLDKNAPSPLSFREQWLRKELRARFPKLNVIVVEEVKTTVIGDHSKHEDVSRGFRLFGDPVTVAEAEAWMVRARSTESMVVTLDTFFISRKQGAAWSGNGGKVESSILSPKEAQALAAEARNNSTLIVAPRLSVFSGQKANINMLEQIAYIKDFDVQVVEGAAIADPIIDVIQDGITLDVQPIIHPDRRHISLNLDVQLSSVKRPIQAVEITLGPSLPGKVTIQVPSVQRSRATLDDLTLGVPYGGLLIQGLARLPKEGGADSGTQPVDVLILLQTSVLDDLEVPALPKGIVNSVSEEAKLVVARWPEDVSELPKLKTGAWVIRNNGTQVGTARGVSFAEHLGLFRIETGKAQVGDTIGH